ncbi:MAG: peptidoglycan DD-metalloendopeptidase family protein [Pelagibacteraceae bacterium]
MLRVIKSNFLNYFRLFNSGIGSVLSSFIKKKYLFYSFLLLLFFTIYVLILNQIKNYAELKQNNFNTFLKSNEFNNIKNYIFKNLNSPYQEFTYTVQNNDTIDKVLRKFDVDVNDIKNITAEIANKKLSNIFINTEIKIITKEDQGINKLVSFFYPIDEITSVEVKRNKDEFVVNKNILKLEKQEVVLSNSIKNNLYSSAIEVGVEPNIIVEFANIFGFEVDFQRDIQVGDKFEIYYERLLDEDGVVRNTGKIFYASMFVNNKEISLYNFKYNNETGFYDVDGKSVIKTLMKTPINGARLSSSFGFRRHPILGFNKLHQGTDFAAKTGTPIMASGSGVVVMAQKYKGYGNYVKIRHNSTYETAYAHMSKYGRGIRKGVRVNQGQIIGYVGSTGLSTGPHLHYEVIENGKRVNSQRLKLPTGKTLDNEARNKFEVERIKIDVRLSNLRKNN